MYDNCQLLEATNQCSQFGGQLPVPKSKKETIGLTKMLGGHVKRGASIMIHLGIIKNNSSSWKGCEVFNNFAINSVIADIYTGKLLEYENWTVEGKRFNEQNDKFLVELKSGFESNGPQPAPQPARYIHNTTIVRNITNDGNFIRKGFLNISSIK